MTKSKILGTIKLKAYSNYMLWAISNDIRNYDKSILFLELYCELTNKSFIKEKTQMWKEYERFKKPS